MKTITPRGLFIVTLAALFYVYDYILQATPGVITNQLLHDFNLDAASLSLLAAYFFYAYAPTQLVGGLLLDRYGPHLLLSLMVGVCALGALFFAIGHTALALSLGRALMGFGSAFSFVGTLLLAARWLPLKHFALTAGLLQALGCIGAIIGQVPIAWMVQHQGWRTSFSFLFYLGIALMLINFVFLRNWPQGMMQRKLEYAAERRSIMQSLYCVFSNRQTYGIALYSFAIWVPVTVFAALWGIPYIAMLYHIPMTQASTLGMMVWLGIAVGSPLFGVWSARLGRRCLPLSCSAVLALLTSLLALYLPMPLWLMYIVMFVFGMGASGQTLIFAVVQDNNPPAVAGTAMGFNNLAVVASGAICQPLAGYLLRRVWDGAMQSGVPVYSIHNFQQAFLLLPIFAVLALIASIFLIRETYCQPVHENRPSSRV